MRCGLAGSMCCIDSQPSPQPSPGGRGRFTEVFSDSAQYRQSVESLQYPPLSPPPSGRGRFTEVFSDSAQYRQSVESLQYPPISPPPSGRGRFTEVFSDSAQYRQSVESLQYPPISPLSLRERALYRGVFRFSAVPSECRKPSITPNQSPLPPGEG